MRRFGKSRQNGITYRARPGAYAILPANGQLLLTHQGGIHNEFQLPGGGIDPGESPIAALHREVFEETGWRIGAIRRLWAFRRYVFMPEYDMHAEKLCHIFLARPIRKLSLPSEAGHTAVWTSHAFAMQNVANPGDRFVLQTLFSPSNSNKIAETSSSKP
ncbi:NUDIX hydrolase [Celeribacter arenosi]|uniref:NUDIX hydrolase n=1 Tax=Celeribacter arenosi TaxID=792649 RepID=A0ABP7JYC1_9RHOB